jgi:FkbM family methyltransferase
MGNMINRIRHCYSRFGLPGVISAIRTKLDNLDRLLKVERKDIKAPFYLRLKTNDIPTFDQVFINQEYDFETSSTPKVIIDAGANIGLASIYFANKYPESKIIAIEPEDSNFRILEKNVAPYANIIPFQAALWDKNELVNLVNPGSGKWGFMTEDKERNEALHGDLCHQIQGNTVDRLMQDYDLQRIDILKIDIEGAEREVFNDSSSWVENVDAMIVELHERMKSGCNRSFYNGSNGFDNEWHQGENVYLSRKKCLTRRCST